MFFSSFATKLANPLLKSYWCTLFNQSFFGHLAKFGFFLDFRNSFTQLLSIGYIQKRSLEWSFWGQSWEFCFHLSQNIVANEWKSIKISVIPFIFITNWNFLKALVFEGLKFPGASRSSRFLAKKVTNKHFAWSWETLNSTITVRRHVLT